LTTFTNAALVSVVFVWRERRYYAMYIWRKIEEKAMLKYLLDSSSHKRERERERGRRRRRGTAREVK
jgi:hypothetical protein